jgi:iron complex transport system substrate-binding protein
MMRNLILFSTLMFSSLSTHAFERIVSIGGTLTEIIYELGQGKKIVGRDATSYFPKEVLEIPSLGYRQSINLEGIVSLKPDLIIASKKLTPNGLITQLRKLKLKIVTIKEEDNFESAREKIRKVSKVLNEVQKGNELIRELDKDLIKVKNLKKKLSKLNQAPKKLMFIYARGGNRIFLSGKKTVPHVMMTHAGFKNGFSEIEGFKPITTESLVTANPDAIILLKKGAESLKEGVWKIKGLSLTNAGKKKNLMIMDDLSFMSFGPRSGAQLISLLHQAEKMTRN